MIVNVIVDICLLPIYVMESDSRLQKRSLINFLILKNNFKSSIMNGFIQLHCCVYFTYALKKDALRTAF